MPPCRCGDTTSAWLSGAERAPRPSPAGHRRRRLLSGHDFRSALSERACPRGCCVRTAGHERSVPPRRRAVERVLAAAGHRRAARPPLPAGLTAREAEVLRLLALGLTTQQTADRLGDIGQDGGPPRAAHLHQDRRLDPRCCCSFRHRTWHPRHGRVMASAGVIGLTSQVHRLAWREPAHRAEPTHRSRAELAIRRPPAPGEPRRAGGQNTRGRLRQHRGDVAARRNGHAPTGRGHGTLAIARARLQNDDEGRSCCRGAPARHAWLAHGRRRSCCPRRDTHVLSPLRSSRPRRAPRGRTRA